jgi:hypothetical protein
MSLVSGKGGQLCMMQKPAINVDVFSAPECRSSASLTAEFKRKLAVPTVIGRLDLIIDKSWRPATVM